MIQIMYLHIHAFISDTFKNICFVNMNFRTEMYINEAHEELD